MHKTLLLITTLLVAVAALPQQTARADIAPPKTPPGTTLLPGAESTQVRMLAETVTLTVSADPNRPEEAIARTEADFTMRNMGSSAESMQVRFPLSFFDGSSDGRFEFPEIPSIAVKVNDLSVPTHREMQPPFGGVDSYAERDEVPWAVFEVTFPPAQDVSVNVTYTVRSYGYYPQAIFEYILETGAGWKGTIGSADIILKLPYEASEMNVLVQESAMSGASTGGGVVSGAEVRWHYEDLEPQTDDNIEMILVTPHLWESVLSETEAVKQEPKDGEAWGRLGKAYKEAARLPKGWLRDDPAGRELVDLSRNAYERCLALLPKDALWHYGFADLLWWDYYQNFYWSGKDDAQGLLPAALRELQQTLALDANNGQARELLAEISSAMDGAVEQQGEEFILLGLTATPAPPTPYPPSSTDAPQVAATGTATSAQPLPAPTRSPTGGPTAANPICGGALLSLGIPLSAVLHRRRHRGR